MGSAGITVAHANPSDGQLPRAHGKGIRIAGDHRLHPGAALTTGWDSNVFQSHAPNPIRRAAFGIASAWAVLESRASVDGELDVPVHDNDHPVEYHLGVIGAFRFYMTPAQVVREEASKFNVGARGRLLLAPRAPVSVMVRDDFYRRGQQAQFEGGAPSYHLNRLDNTASLGLRFRPGGGRLSLESAVTNSLLYYESVAVSIGDRVTVGSDSEVKWRFVDRSALFVRHRYDYFYYKYWEVGSGFNQDSKENQFDAGFRGQLGRWLNLDVSLGYRQMRFIWDVKGPHFRGFVFDTRLAVFPTRGMSLQLGGHRTAKNAVFGNFMVDVGGDLRLTYSLDFGLRFDLDASIVRRNYVGLPRPKLDFRRIERYIGAVGPDSKLERVEDLFELAIGIQQELRGFIVIGLGYRLTNVSSDFAAVFDPQVYGNYVEYAAFRRQLLELTLAVRY